MSAEEQLDIGNAFERYLANRFGWKLCGMDGQQHGDTVCRTEIKYDRLLHKTGNLFIECRECWTPGQALKAAGILKQCRQYAIGDCSRVLLFSGNRLVVLREKAVRELNKEHSRYILCTPKTGPPTAIGFCGKYEYFRWLAGKDGEFTWNATPLHCEESYDHTP